MSNSVGKHMKTILTKLFSIAGKNYEEGGLVKGWRKEYAWSEEEKKLFVAWLEGYLNNPDARTALCSLHINASTRGRNTTPRSLAESFCDIWGWNGEQQ